MSESDCERKSTLEIFTGTFLTVGIFISIIPQMAILVTRKTNEGLSPYFLFMYNVSAYSQVLSAVLSGWNLFLCCEHVDFGTCNQVLLTTYQQAISPVMLVLLFMLFLFYYERNASTRERAQEKKIAWVLYIILVFFFIGVLTLTGALILHFYGRDSDHLKRYAFSMGILSTVVVFIQFLPQIYTTWKLKSAGSLSIWTLLIQAPGAFVVVVYQAIMSHKPVSDWLSYLASGTGQMVLIAMITYYYVKDYMHKKKMHPLQEGVMDDNNLRQPLIPDTSTDSARSLQSAPFADDDGSEE